MRPGSSSGRIAITPPLVITAAGICEICARFRAGPGAAWAAPQERPAVAAE